MNFRDQCIMIASKLDSEGSGGMDILSYKNTKSGSFYVYRRYWMTDSALDLGQALHEKVGMNPKLWVLWMQCAEAKHYDNAILIKHITPFFAAYAERELGSTIGKAYKKPVHFVVDDGLRASVYQTQGQ